MFASPILGGAAGDPFQPAPQNFFIIEGTGVAQDPEECLLQGFARFIFIAMSDHQQEQIEPIKVTCVKLSECLVLAVGKPPAQAGDVARCVLA